MLNYLKECTRQTQIGLLPDIINHNNDAIKKEFDYIYDSSLNRLTKSVYAPVGSVKAHMGEFVNLSTEYLTVKNVESMKDTIYKAVEEILIENASDHNALEGRFQDPDDKSKYVSTICHDASSIAYSTEKTVTYAINELYTDINDHVTRFNVIDGKIVEIRSEITDLTDKISYVQNIAETANETANESNVIAKSAEQTANDCSSKVISLTAEFNKLDTKVSTYDASMNMMNSSVIYAVKTADAAAVSVSKYDTSINRNTNDINSLYIKVDEICTDVDNAVATANDAKTVATQAKTDATQALNIANRANITNNIQNTSYNTIILPEITKHSGQIRDLDSSCKDFDIRIDKNTNYVTNLNRDVNDISTKFIVNTNKQLSAHDSSISTLQSKFAAHDTEIINIKKDIVNINSSISGIKQQINNKTGEIDASITGLKQNITDISTGVFSITYNGVTYQIKDMIDLITWKNSLTTQTITYKDGNNVTQTITVLCPSGTAQVATQANNKLGQLTGNTSPLVNPGAYTATDITNATNRMTGLIGPNRS